MSKTQSKTKVNTTTPSQRCIPTANAGEKQRPARTTAPQIAAIPAARASRAKQRVAPQVAVTGVMPDVVPASRRPGKQATIEALIRRPEGAAIADLRAATGWQQHSVRAALTGLRKQGYHLIREAGPAGGSVYRITHEQHRAKA